MSRFESGICVVSIIVGTVCWLRVAYCLMEYYH